MALLSRNNDIVQHLSDLGRTLAAGEIHQLSNISSQDFSEDAYYQVIEKKTASLFESCCILGSISVGASEETIKKAAKFGYNIGMIFQIRDDIFDYYDSPEIGKPTGKSFTIILAANGANLQFIKRSSNFFFASCITLTLAIDSFIVQLSSWCKGQLWFCTFHFVDVLSCNLVFCLN